MSCSKQQKQQPKRMEQTSAPTFTKHGFEKLYIISTGPESGWREVDESRVQEILQIIKDGQFNKTIMKAPALRGFQGRPVLDRDGRMLLSDGKHTVIACLRASEEYEKTKEDLASGAIKEEDQKVSWSDDAVKMFEDGLDFELADYPENDHDLVVAYNVLIHDESANTWKKTNIGDLCRAAKLIQQKVAGGSWDQTKQRLLNIYGSGRRSFVHRMCIAAQCTPKEVQDKCATLKHIPTSYLTENRFFVGRGANAGKQLSTEGQPKNKKKLQNRKHI